MACNSKFSVMKKNTKQILSVLQVATWIIFIGLCIKAGAILFSFLVSLFIDPAGAKNLYLELNLYALKDYSTFHYVRLGSLLVLLWILKAYLFYFVIKIFLKINFVHPFSTEIAALILKISYVALAIGVFSVTGNAYAEWLTEESVVLPVLDEHLGGGAEYLFFAGIIYFIAQIFNKGIEIQSENELTV